MDPRPAKLHPVWAKCLNRWTRNRVFWDQMIFVEVTTLLFRSLILFSAPHTHTPVSKW